MAAEHDIRGRTTDGAPAAAQPHAHKPHAHKAVPPENPEKTQPRKPARPVNDPPPQAVMGLLNYLTATSLDEDYAHVSKQRATVGAPTRRSPGTVGLVVLAVFGVLVATAAVQTSRNADESASSRESLVNQVNSRKAELNAKRAQATSLTRSVAALQNSNLDATNQGRAVRSRLDRLGAVTGLANRVLFADRLDRALLQPEATVSVLFCDLDDFKHVNDDLGHEAGDVLLERVADRLLDCVRATDTVARLGGDEFAILLEDSADAVQVADRVVAAMTEPVEVAGRELRTSISVGIAHHQGTAPPPAERRTIAPRTRSAVPAGHTEAAAHRESTAQLLLRQADGAMYAAKGAGKSRAVLADVAAE